MTRPDGQMTKVEINGTGQSSHLYATNNIAKKNKLTDSIPNIQDIHTLFSIKLLEVDNCSIVHLLSENIA